MEEDKERRISVGDVIKEELINSKDEKMEIKVEAEADMVDVDINQVFEWDADEFEYHEKGNKWLWSFGAIVVVLLVVFGLMKYWTGMVIIFLSAILVYQYSFKKPRKLHYVLTKDGLMVGEKKYEFGRFVGYWITTEGWLYMETKFWPPRLKVELISVDVKVMDIFLGKFLKKIERSDIDAGDKMSNWLKF